MKKIIAAGISALIGLSVIGASLSTPAHAGKKQRKIAVGLAIGAVAGIIIAGELSRRGDRKRVRKARRKAHRKHTRQVRHQPRHQRRHQQRWQRDRFYDDFDRYDRNERDFYPDRNFDAYANDYRHEPQVTFEPKRQASNKTRGHTQRCIKAYRSYDPQSDTYIGYDGKERVCRK